MRTATYAPKTEFSTELHQRVDAYFESSRQSRRDVPRMYVKTVIMLGWLFTSYVFLVFFVRTSPGAVLGALSLGLAMAGVGFNVQHDGGHGAYSKHGWINKMMALSLDLLGGTAYFWHFKHNIAHHTHTNIEGHDNDIDLGPLGRVSPHQAWHSPHRFQFVYLWGIYALLALEWQLTGEFRHLISKRWVASTHVPVPRGREMLIFWVGKLTFFSLAFGLPLCFHSFRHVAAVYLLAAVTLGILVATVFQLAHCSGAAAFRRVTAEHPSIDSAWAEHQVATTVDFARGNRLFSWYVGGLNFQIEHHLFPKICHVHYAALAPIVEAVCRAHGVPYYAHPTVRHAVLSHIRWLRLMGQRPAVAV